MCGISTVVTLRSQIGPAAQSAENPHLHTNGMDCTGDALEKKLQNSLDRIAHRGPDARGIWTSEQGQVGK